MVKRPERRLARWGVGRATLVVLGCWLVACAPPPANDPEPPVLEVHHRLFGLASAAAAGATEPIVPAFDAVGYCAVGDEIRPALGCPTFVRKWQWRDDAAAGGAVEHRLEVHPSLAMQPLVVERAFRVADREPWMPLPPLRLARGRKESVVSFDDAPARSQTRAIAHLAMPPAVLHKAAPIEIPPKAVLIGGFGLHALGAEGGVRFLIRARVDGRRRTLLDERVARAEARWQDYRVDLGDVEGRQVEFTFTTSGVGSREGAGPLPLWSRPVIVGPSAERTMPNVILISLDTLRGDYVGVSGRARARTPALDGLAAAGAYFADAIAPYPSTTASHMSLFTALYPSVHEILRPSSVLPHAIPMLAETLADARYATAAVTEDAMLLARSGFQRGFDSYREFKEALQAMTSGHIEDVMGAGLAWVDAHRDERFFLFLHTYQVHAPYAPPPEFHRHRDSDDGTIPQLGRDRRAYADEVEYADHVVGEFLQALGDRGLRERTIVIVVSDHGEAFGEHGLVRHGSGLHDPQVRVPLILSAPGRIPAGVRSEVPVSLVDVAPTLLELLGLATPSAVQGRSLVPILEGRDDADLQTRPVFAELKVHRRYEIAARRATMKWIDDTHSLRAFDLRTDPDESSARTAPADVAPGSRMVARFRRESSRLRAAVGGSPVPTAAPIAPEAEDRLRALGYLE